jgi:hypothetical protein
MITLPGIHGARLIRHHAAAICALLLALIAAAPAAAQRQDCEAPPGRSGVEQYCEALPLAGGPQAGGRDESSGVDRATADRLRSAGRDGGAVLSLTDGVRRGAGSEGGSGGGPASGMGDERHSRSAAGTDGGRTPSADEPGDPVVDDPPGNLLSALRSSVEDGPTLSSAFPWVLIAIAIGCFALAWFGWRRGRPDEHDIGGSTS